MEGHVKHRRFDLEGGGIPAKPTRSFEALVKAVPLDAFIRMVSLSGLPTADARELCAAFKRLKNDGA
jgi:hypothetical protein